MAKLKVTVVLTALTNNYGMTALVIGLIRTPGFQWF
jgi:hypothetical protein